MFLTKVTYADGTSERYAFNALGEQTLKRKQKKGQKQSRSARPLLRR